METLQARVDRSGPLSPSHAVGWVVRLCKRIDELHRLGVAHGGVSAYCLLIEGDDPAGAGMLADVRDAATRPSYHCPERLGGAAIGLADDTWAATCLLFFSLTGRMPFEGELVEEIRTEIERGRPPLRQFHISDERLEAVFSRFLELDKGKRGRHLRDLLASLEAWRGNLPALAPLDESPEDSLQDPDDEERIATVMRDFGAVQDKIASVLREKAAGGGGPEKAQADDRSRATRATAPRPKMDSAHRRAGLPGPPPPPPPPPGPTVPSVVPPSEDESIDGGTVVLATTKEEREDLRAAWEARVNKPPPPPEPAQPPPPPAVPSPPSGQPSASPVV
ncbi:MAG: hypothetical protein AAGA56_11815, partial [Myxococcota bacterium]